MVHRVAGEGRRRVAMAATALHGADWNVRRRPHPDRLAAIVAVRATRIARLMGIEPAAPARVGRAGAGVARNAIRSTRRTVAGIRGRALRAFRSLARELSVVTGIAPARAYIIDDRGVVHCIAGEARRRVAVAAAALNGSNRDVRRHIHAGRSAAVVTT